MRSTESGVTHLCAIFRKPSGQCLSHPTVWTWSFCYLSCPPWTRRTWPWQCPTWKDIWSPGVGCYFVITDATTWLSCDSSPENAFQTIATFVGTVPSAIFLPKKMWKNCLPIFNLISAKWIVGCKSIAASNWKCTVCGCNADLPKKSHRNSPLNKYKRS